MGGGRVMEPTPTSSTLGGGSRTQGTGASGGGGAAGTTFTGQGTTGDAALGGGVQDPTPID